MKKPLIIALMVAAVTALAIAYVNIGPVPKSHTVRVIAPPSIIASLPIWIADHEQMFVRRNLEIEYINLTSSRLMVEAMIAGNADVLPAVSLADLTTTGGPGNTALLHVFIYSHSRLVKNPPFESILVTRGSNLSILKDLEGGSIAVYPGTTSELAVKHYLRLNKVDPDKINYVKLPPPEHEPALIRGDVQAIHVYEPYRSASLESGKTTEFAGSVYASLSEPSAIGASAIARKFLREKPKVAEQYFAAWDEAILFIRNNSKEARKILSERLGLPESVSLKATWVDATTTDETDFVTLSNTIASAQAAGIIPNAFLLEKDMVLER